MVQKTSSHPRMPARFLAGAHSLSSGMLGMRLAVLHNLYFYNNLMEVIRTQLDNGTYMEFYEKYRNILGVRI